MDTVLEYKSILMQGTLVTVSLAVLSLLLSVLLGLLAASLKLSSSLMARRIGNIYVTLVRSVPDLVLMMLIFYGGQALVNHLGGLTGWWDYVDLNQFIAGVLTLGFIFGAYMAETFRGAILAIPAGQHEAAVACGMNRFQVFRLVTWPQMVRHALPGFSNNWLVLVKSTALVSVIGLHDLVWNAVSAGRSTQQLFSFLSAVLIIYLCITAVSDLCLRKLDRRFSAGVERR
ncbi:ABC transporter permease [Granulosicoccus sp. 3-233]|uniref:ABC transporter permease n=1 Tax=Granulosicoccus sp. 3-233 TaxID=3417969 RepID=UPI003D33C772